MKRTKERTSPDAILTSDWHIRSSKPTARTDDFMQAQFEKIKYVSDLQRKYDCDVIHAGDFFHYWKPSPGLLTDMIQRLPNRFLTIYGQHDLPGNNYDNHIKSGLNTLNAAGKVHILSGTHWGQEPKKSLTIGGNDILVWHKLVWKNEEPYPDVTRKSQSQRILNKYGDDFDLIVTGDNHKPFVDTGNNCVLVNPGSFTRQSADETHRPRVYLWWADNSKIVVPSWLPYKEDAITRQHIERKEKEDKRIKAFVDRLNSDWDGVVSFEDNLEMFFEKNNISDSVKNIIYESLDEE